MSQDAPAVDLTDARRQSIGLESLRAEQRDVLFILISENRQGDPREGVPFSQLIPEIEHWYDRRGIAREIAEELEELCDTEFANRREDGYVATTDALEAAEAHLRRLGKRWEHVHDWEDGSKLVVREAAPVREADVDE